MFRLFRFFPLLLLLAPTCFAQLSVPSLTGRVVDRADILSPSVESNLTQMLRLHEDSTSNQIAVLTMPSLKGEVLEDFSIEVARTWELGTANNDNGVLLLIAVEERQIRIEVGDGLTGTLTDAYASRVIRNGITPHFKRGDYDEGVTEGVKQIIGIIEGTYLPEASSSSNADAPPFWFGVIFMIIPSFFAFLGVLSYGCGRWFLMLFLVPFFGVSGFALTGSGRGALIVVALYLAAFNAASFHPKVVAAREKLKDGKKAKLWGMTLSPGGSGGFSGGSSGGSGFSSSSSSFSGGGGSFSGGGASGGW